MSLPPARFRSSFHERNALQEAHEIKLHDHGRRLENGLIGHLLLGEFGHKLRQIHILNGAHAVFHIEPASLENIEVQLGPLFLAAHGGKAGQQSFGSCLEIGQSLLTAGLNTRFRIMTGKVSMINQDQTCEEHLEILNAALSDNWNTAADALQHHLELARDKAEGVIKVIRLW